MATTCSLTLGELMAKNRHNPVPDFTPKSVSKPQEVLLLFKPCCMCGKTILEGYYARWDNGGVCSKDCNTKRETQPGFLGEEYD